MWTLCLEMAYQEVSPPLGNTNSEEGYSVDLGTMRFAVRDILGEDFEDFWKDSQLTAYLNEAQHRFTQSRRWPWLITELNDDTLQAGDPYYELPPNVETSREMNVLLTAHGQSRPYSPHRVDPTKGYELRSLYIDTNKTTYPLWYYLAYGNTSVYEEGDAVYYLRFVPVPVGDLSISFQYFRRPAPMVDDSETPDLPEQYHKALVHFAAGTAWLKELNGEQKAGEQMAMFQAIVQQATEEFRSDPDDTPLVAGKDEPQFDRRHWRGDPTLMRVAPTLGP